MRKQNGSITQFNRKWYLRYYERRLDGGVLVRRKATHFLGEVVARAKKPPEEITKAAEDYMRSVRDCVIPAARVVSLADFVEGIYLPMVKETYRPSTHKGYGGVWRDHIKPASSMDSNSLKNIKCFHVQGWLKLIGQGELSRNSLKRIQSSLSGIFTYAKQLGFYDGVNPVQDTRINPKAAEPAETYSYTLEEIGAILDVLPEPAATAFAVAAYTGLRRGEIEGLEWPDYRDMEVLAAADESGKQRTIKLPALWVSRSIWNGRELLPKTTKSRAAVPVIRQLAERLELHRLRCGNPQTGPIFANTLGKRVSINNLLSRAILPALNRCGVCHRSDGKPHLKQEHDYVRDASLPQWHGWHACRRGLGSNLYRLGAPDKVIQLILRHSNVATTLGYYVKLNGPDGVAAMEKFEQRVDEQTAAHAAQLVQDCDGTLKTGTGATCDSVN